MVKEIAMIDNKTFTTREIYMKVLYVKNIDRWTLGCFCTIDLMTAGVTGVCQWQKARSQNTQPKTTTFVSSLTEWLQTSKGEMAAATSVF